MDPTSLRFLPLLLLVLLSLATAVWCWTLYRRTADALRRSEQRHRLLVENASDAVAVLDDTIALRYVSPSVERVMGYAEREVIGRSCLDLVHPDDRARVAAFFAARVREPGLAAALEFRMRRADGEWAVIEAMAKNVAGDPVMSGLVVNLRDITRRRRAEEALRESDERYRAFVQQSSEGIWREEIEPPLDVSLPVEEQVDHLLAHCRIAETNDAMARMYGCASSAELVGLPLYTFLDPAVPANREHLRLWVRSGYRLTDAESYERDSSGAPRVFLNTIVGIVEDGRLVRKWGIQRDITERKAVAEELARQRAFLRQVIDLNPNFIMARDREGRFTLANRSCAAAYGTTVEDMLGKTDLDFGADPALVESFRNTDRQVIETGRELVLPEERVRDPSGRERWVQTHKQPIRGPGGAPDQVLLVATDITERKRTERELSEQRSFLRQVLDLNPSFIFTKDREGRYTLVNRAFAEALGTTVEGMLGKGDAEVHPYPEEVAIFRREDLEVLESGRDVSVPELKTTDLKGRPRWVQIMKRPIRSPDGTATLVLGVATDITERKQAELVQAAVYRIAQAADTAARLDDLYRSVHEIVGEVMPARNFYIALYDRRRDLLGFPYFVDQRDPPPSPHALGRGLTAYVLRTGAPLLCRPADVAELERRGEVVLLGTQCQIWLGVPLTVGDETLGVMVVQDYDDPAAYGERERQVLEFVSSQVAKAIERKRLEEARAYERELWSNLMDNVPDTIYFKDTALRFTRINRAQARVLGVAAPEDSIGRTDADFFDPDHARAAAEDERRIIATGDPLLRKVERVHTVATGETRWFSATKVPIRDGTGQTIGMVGMSREVTDLVRTETALRESEERYRALYEQNPSMYFTVDQRGMVLSVNAFGAGQLGYTPEELVGRPVLGVFHPEDVEGVREQVHTCLAAPGEVRQWEFRKVRKNGSVLWVRETARAVRRADGSMEVFIVCEDVTRQKEAEVQRARLQADVQRSALEWRRTFDAIASPILILDPEGRVVRLNEAAKNLAHLGYEAILGCPVGSVGRGEPWHRAAELAEFVRSAGSGTASQVHDEASDRTWDVVASLVTAEDGIRIIVAARDITRLVQLQESLRRSETMSAMGSLVAGVAHEVRNPLFSMTATLDAFEARYGVRREYQKHLGVLRSQLDRLTHLMQELLDYGKPPSLELASGTVDGVITQAIEACAPHAKQARVKVVRKVRKHLPALPMDRLRMVQVFTNIVENAFQHSPPGGTVTVEARPLEVGRQRWIDCTVTDTGPGFHHEDLPRVFEPFYTKRRGGTGLGLSLVQRIVEQHGGRVSAENLPAGGAVIRLRLPVAAP